MWYWLIRKFLISVFKLFFKFKVEGLENLPKKTNFIVAANHSSFLDPLIIAAAMPKRVYWIAMRALYKVSWLAWVMNKFGVLPTGNSSERAVRLLLKNKNVCIFPEGGISRDGSLKEFRRGAALLALRTGRPVVPCAILGANQALPRTAKFPRMHPIKVKIGKPKYLLKEHENMVDDIFLQDGIFKIRNTIKEMMENG